MYLVHLAHAHDDIRGESQEINRDGRLIKVIGKRNPLFIK